MTADPLTDPLTGLDPAVGKTGGPTLPDRGWAPALAGLGYGLFAWSQPGPLTSLASLSTHSGPEAPAAEVADDGPAAPDAHAGELRALLADLPTPTADGPHLVEPDPWFAGPSDVGPLEPAAPQRSLLDEDLAAAFELDRLPDDVPTVTADEVRDDTGSLPALTQGIAPVEQPAYAARRDTIAMLEEIAFLDE